VTVGDSRASVADVDLDAIAANVATLVRVSRPAAVCAVVKADGYGHGAVEVARAALDGGAGRLAVAVADEGVALRRAGVDAPILVLAEVGHADAAELVARHGLEATVASPAGAALLACHAAAGPVRVHLKVDTGMHRIGVPVDDAVAVATEIDASPHLELAGTCTHLAVADEPERPETAAQLDRFEGVLAALVAAGVDPGLRHAANSAGALLHPRSRYDLVRCGIAVYGIHPSAATEAVVDLRPALSLRSTVSQVTRVPAGDGVSYGLFGAAAVDRTIATVPVGYADGVDRRLGRGVGSVLVGGRRRPIVGAVTMDQLMVDCGDDAVERGDEVVLLGTQGDETVDAAEWAAWMGTIPYEVVARLGPRLPRRTRRG
jgi:alanine racemase